MARLAGKTVFITGAGAGIGRAAAELFAAEGAQIAAADISIRGGEETVSRVQAAGGEAIFIETDVTEPDSVQSAIQQAVARFGKLNVIYNNAGDSTAADGPVTEAPLEEFWRAIKLDLYGTFLGCRFGIPELIKAGGGSVINMASNVALMGFPGRDCYTASKGGIVSITRSMAIEYAPHNIRVNAIAPATTRTDRVVKLMAADADIARVTEAMPLGLIEPIDIAFMALYLASDESRITTGQIIPVDSGSTV